MRFFYSTSGISQRQTTSSKKLTLPSTEQYRGKTIPFSHIHLSGESYFSEFSSALSSDERASLIVLTSTAQRNIATHPKCPKNLATLNIQSVKDWHTHLDSKKEIHILLVGGFGDSSEHIHKGICYLQRITKLLVPVKIHFHLMQANNVDLSSTIKSSNITIHPNCISTSTFLSVDFYLDLNPIQGQPLRSKLLPLFEKFNTNADKFEQYKIAVVIPHFGSQTKLNRCLNALITVKGFDPRWLYIVDNNSNNRYFTKGVNTGLEKALEDDCDFFWILNNDTKAHPDYLLASLERFLKNPRIGLVGGKNLVTERPDRIFWGGSHQAFPTGTHKAGYVSKNSLNHATKESWATFSSVIIRRDTIKQCGLLDANMKMIFSDSDYCFQIGLKGWQVWYEPKAIILHDTGVSRSTPNQAMVNIFKQDKIAFYHKWSKITQCKDPEKLQDAIFTAINFKQ